jgi:hypothetical protein
VPDQDFFFALEMSPEPPFEMLAELVRSVFAQAGYGEAAIDAMKGEMRAALAGNAATGQRRCELRFTARDGELEIVVAAAGRPEWRTIRPLPVS